MDRRGCDVSRGHDAHVARTPEAAAEAKGRAVTRVPPRYVVLVTGSRHWRDEDAIRRRLTIYPSDTLVIHGGCEGADIIADRVTRQEGMRVLAEGYFRDLGAEGGPARNALLVDLARCYAHHGYKVVCEAFPQEGSRGTWNCVKIAETAGITVEVTRG